MKNKKRLLIVGGFGVLLLLIVSVVIYTLNSRTNINQTNTKADTKNAFGCIDDVCPPSNPDRNESIFLKSTNDRNAKLNKTTTKSVQQTLTNDYETIGDSGYTTFDSICNYGDYGDYNSSIAKVTNATVTMPETNRQELSFTKSSTTTVKTYLVEIYEDNNFYNELLIDNNGANTLKLSIYVEPNHNYSWYVYSYNNYCQYNGIYLFQSTGPYTITNPDLTYVSYNQFTNVNKVFNGDFDGDGYADILYSTTSENNDGIAGNNDLAWYLVRNPYSGTSDLLEEQVFTSYGVASDNFYISDFNGDSRDDLLLSTIRVNTNKTVTNDLAWFLAASTSQSQFQDLGMINSSYGIQQASDQYYVSDFNGDNKDDIVISTTRVDANKQVANDLAWFLMSSNGSVFTDGGKINSSYGVQQSSDKYYVSDFNGDGKSDMLVTTTRVDSNKQVSNDLAWYLMSSNGSTYLDGGQVSASYGVSTDEYYISNLTGDRKDEILVSTDRVNNNGTLSWYLIKSTGSSLVDGGNVRKSLGKNNENFFAGRKNTSACTGYCIDLDASGDILKDEVINGKHIISMYAFRPK